MREFSDDNEVPSERDTADVPRFGRLLLVLAFAVLVIIAVTVGSEAYFS